MAEHLFFVRDRGGKGAYRQDWQHAIVQKKCAMADLVEGLRQEQVRDTFDYEIIEVEVVARHRLSRTSEVVYTHTDEVLDA